MHPLIRSSVATVLCLALAGTAQAADTTKTDPTESQTTLTREQRAALWDLKTEDWTRYEAIMAGPRGLWSPDLDPVWVLGIHAKSDSERQRYAELAVEREKARVEAELAFQRAYDAAWQRLYPDLPLVDATRLTARATASATPNAGDRLLLFVTEDCNQCGSWLRRVLAAVDDGSPWGVDIYLAGMNSDQAIRDWAADNTIPTSLVRQRRVTLNHDNGTLERLTDKTLDAVPVLLHRQDGQVHVTTPGQLDLP